MKKAFYLSLIFFFALALAGFIPVKADDVVVNGSYEMPSVLTEQEYNNLTNTSLLLEFLRQGGVIDTSNVSAGYTVQDLISDFGSFFNDVCDGIVSFIDPTYPATELRPLSPAVRNNVTKFIGKLPSRMGNSTPVPTPNPDYATYIDIINGSGFFWKNYSSSYDFGGGYYQDALVYPYGNYSWIASINTDTYNSSSNILDYSGNAQAFASNIISIYINEENGVYSFSNSFSIINPIAQNRWNSVPWQALYFYNNTDRFEARGMTVYNTYYIQFSGTLTQCLDKVATIFRNVNIYVNNEPWSIVGSNQNYTLKVYNNTVPDIATNDYGYVHWVYDYEIFYRIDRIWDILEDLVNRTPDPSDPTSTIIQWPDVSNVIVDVDGQPAVAVRIYTPDSNIDEEYLSKYGPLIPVFIPLATPVINDSDIFLIASTPMSALPNDLLDVFGYIFIGCLFVCFIHRLLE